MAKYSRHEVLTTIYEQGIMPLFYQPDLDAAKQLTKACYDGGGRLLEFTNRGDFAHEVFGELSQYALRELPGMMLGVGSVVDTGTASLYLQLGACFIVSASLREDVALACNRRKVAYLPGCSSLTEIARAEELGCEIVKLFPGSLYGPGFIKAVTAPQPWTSIMPTGGVSPDEENMTGWIRAGAVCLGMGSQMINQTVVDSGDYAALSAQVRDTLALSKRLRA